tara:strand:+ start:217 stop:711 length:495 start_codon:yes stop_codon:yes gene_type:complete
MMMRLSKSARLIRFLTALIVAFHAGTAVADSASFSVVIQTPEGNQFNYLLELAGTPAARQKGLMNRYHLGSGEGMLFVWQEEDYRSFWMKNTPISLDILFFSSELTLVSRHENTVPFSKKRLPSGKPARYVVELIAGEAKLQGLEIGSLLILPEGLMRALNSQS